MLFKFQFPSSNRIRFQEFTKEQFLVFAAEVAKKLKWELTPINESELVFRTPSNWFKWGRTIYVKLEEVPLNENDIAGGKKLLVYCTSKRKGKKLLEEVEKGMSALTIDQISSKVSDFENSGGFQANFDSGNLLVDQRTWWQKFLALFQIGKNYVATPILLYINVGVFLIVLLLTIIGSGHEGARFGLRIGNFLPVTFDGQWWRLLSAFFLHFDLFHLVGNMVGLLYAGFLMEKYLGTKRFTATYLGIGFFSGLFSSLLNPAKILMGASGAIIGIFGVLLAMSATMLRKKAIQKVQITIASFLMLDTLLLGFFLFDSSISSLVSMDHLGHFSGFASGILVGFALLQSFNRNKKHLLKAASYFVIILSILTIVISSGRYLVKRSSPPSFEIQEPFTSINEPISPIMIKRIDEMNVTPRSREFYTEKMNRFVTMESMALEVLNYSNEDSEKYVNDLKNRGIYYWNENISLLREFDQLNLPASLSEKHKLLEDYCNQNIRLYELKHLKATEKSNKYDEAIYDYREKIESLKRAILRK